MGDFFQNLGNGMSKVANGAMDAVNQMGARAGNELGADVKQIEDGYNKDGIIGGVGAFFDQSSVGHRAVEGAAIVGIQMDDETRRNVEGGINIVAGASMGLAGIPLLADGFAKIGEAPSAGGPPSAAHSTASPSEHMSKHDAFKRAQHEAQRQAAIDAAKHKAHDRTIYNEGYQRGVRDAGPRMHTMPYHPGKTGFVGGAAPSPAPDAGDTGATSGAERDGYASQTTNNYYFYGDVVGGDYGSVLDDLHKKFGDDKIGQAKSKLQDIMNDPSLSFEDKIFELMLALMQDGQDDVKKLSDDLDADDTTTKEQRGQLDDKINAKRKELETELGAKSPDEHKIQSLNTEIQSLTDARNEFVSDKAESRQKTAEKMKNALEKLSEMQQALSNVLNAMHENAMSAIRNIK